MINRSLQIFGIIGLSAVLLVAVVAFASNSQTADAAPDAQATTNPAVIVVSGTGTVAGQPDEAVISIGAQITAPTLADATAQAATSMTKVLDAIKAQGIDPKDIQTSSYNVSPITNYKEGQTPETTGYQVTNIVNVTVRDLSKVGAVLDAGMGAGANYLGGVSFSIADPSPLQAQAQTLAVKDAMASAQTLADAAGVKLGKIISISDAGTLPPQPLASNRAVLADAAAAPGPVATGSLEVTSNVQMRFEIAQ